MAIVLRLWSAPLFLAAIWGGFTGLDLLRSASRYRDDFTAVMAGYSGASLVGGAVILTTLGLLCWGMADLLEQRATAAAAKKT